MQAMAGHWIFDHAKARQAYAGMPVLVLGADGFMGRNCTRVLAQMGADVTALVRDDAGDQTVTGVHRVKGELQDEKLLPDLVAGQGIIFDFIGASGAARSNREPVKNLLGECLPQLSLLQALKRKGLQPTIIFCISRLVYGQPCYLPVDEAHPLQPLSMYAVHKLTVEHYLEIYRRQAGIHYCSFRLSNPYGPFQPRQTSTYGIINLFIRQAVEGQSIRIYGDGRQRRDYIHVDDVIGVFLLSAIDENCRDRVFNLGGREAISLRDAAALIAQLAGAPEIQHVPWPAEEKSIESGDYLSSMVCLEQALELPDFLSFADGISKVLASYRRAGEDGIAGQG